ncbi:MAG: hypothetical protein K1X64_11350 [Myxococcaceae bacterium]|nr:hypothetical protein [Myxococcaceae bacterium]
MKTLLAVVALTAVVVGSVSMTTSISVAADEKVDEARVLAQIDARLHAVLLKLRQQKLNQ